MADLVGQLNGNGQKGMLHIDAPPVENFWLRHCVIVFLVATVIICIHCYNDSYIGDYLIVVRNRCPLLGMGTASHGTDISGIGR